MGTNKQNFALLTVGILSLLSTSTGEINSGQDNVINRPIFDPNLKPIDILLFGSHSLNPAPTAQAKLLEPTMPVFENTSMQIIKEAKRGLQYIFQTESPYVAAIAGSGITAFQAALDNMIEPGDLVLIPVNGYWPRRGAQTAKRLGATVMTLQNEPGITFDVEELKDTMRKILPKVVFIVVGESVSGVVQDIRGIGDLCIELGCYLVTDVVSMVGIQPVNFDALKIDAAFCNTQKGIGSITGMAGMVYSPRAIARVKARTIPPKSFDHDVSMWVQENFWFMNEDADRPQEPTYQFPMVMIYALREGLRLIAEEGIENIWKRHETTHDYFLTKLAAEFPQFVNPIKKEDQLIGTVVFTIPDESKQREILDQLRIRHLLHITRGGGSPSFLKKMRVSIFGPNAQEQVVDKIFSALTEVVNNL